MRIAVCDDEPSAAGELVEMLGKALPDCGTVCFSGGAELLAAEDFDIVLLDIQMDGVSGIETARRLRARGSDAVIVFVTGAREYVFDAFDVAAFHYLVKPVDPEKLAGVLSRAVHELRRRAGRTKRQLFIRTRNGSSTVALEDILFLESTGRKLILHTTRETVSFYGSMSEYEKRLGEGFFRSHRGFLVNLEQIAGYDGETIRFPNGESAYLSRERYPGFVKRYMRFLREGGSLDV